MINLFPKIRTGLRLLHGQTTGLVAGGIGIATTSALTLLVPPLLGRLVAGFPGISRTVIFQLAGIMLVRAIIGFAGACLIHRTAARVVIVLRRRIFEKFLRAPVAFHDQNVSAGLVSAITSDALFLEQMLGSLLPALAQYLPVAGIGTLLLAMQNPTLTAAMAVASLPLLAVAWLSGTRQRRNVYGGQKTLAELAVLAQESLQGQRLIKGLGREQLFIQRFYASLEKLWRFRSRRAVWLASVERLQPLATVGSFIVGAWIAHRQWQAGQVTRQELTVFAAYLAIVGSNVIRLVQTYATLEGAAGAAERVTRITNRLLPERSEVQHPVHRAGAGEIEFKNVTFLYPGTPDGVREVNLQIRPAELIALTGPNGAGKSTLGHLLLRFYDPQSGAILLDGQSAVETDLASWRQRFAVVTRDPVIFSFSIADNIALGRPDAPRAEIENAARAVGLKELIEKLPGGFDANVGEGGVRLSAGQRQRLALARVFLQDPEVIILDEATSSLDADSEAAVAQAMKHWIGKRTMIFVSHKLDPSWPVTRVVKLESGRVIFQ